MKLPRGNLFWVWTLISILWLAFVLDLASRKGVPDVETAVKIVVVLVLLPPSIFFIAGLALEGAWKRYGQAHWLRAPQHIRRGLLRLYLVVAVPWVAWFVFQIHDAIQHVHYGYDRYVARAFWLLLIVPIAGPILCWAIIWVVTGFQKSNLESEPKPTPTTDRPAQQSNSGTRYSWQEYYAIIDRAVSQLPINDRETRQQLYVRARTTLETKLQGQDRSRTKYEWRMLETAIREVERKRPKEVERKQQKLKPRSTGGLVASMWLLPSLWATDVTSMSLYWVARLPKISK